MNPWKRMTDVKTAQHRKMYTGRKIDVGNKNERKTQAKQHRNGRLMRL